MPVAARGRPQPYVDLAAELARLDDVFARRPQVQERMTGQIADALVEHLDVLGVIVFIFVLLLITDILGLTKIFPFTRSVR